uniref:RRM domain-containing protein n=1 Tax=Esox lucius TaxID=8010 RepID=A0A3P9AIH5_ESOLU
HYIEPAATIVYSHREINGKPKHEPNNRKERPQKRGGVGRFEPYGNPSKRYRVFVSNIPYDVKWQALKDLMKEKGKVGEVTYVETLMDGEGKSRVSFRTEELMKKAVEKVNKHSLNGRPLKVKEDPDGVIAQRDAHRAQGGGGGGGGPPGGHGGMNMGMNMDRMNMERMNMDRMGPGPGAPPMVNIPPSLMNNPNIPNEIIHGLQAGKIGSTVFVANLDYKVGWKKLKEVFGMAGVVVRADILEDKDGKSRGMGTVTFDMPIEAVQAVSMFNGQMLFNRVMHVKLDEKSLPKGDFAPPERPPALPRKYNMLHDPCESMSNAMLLPQGNVACFTHLSISVMNGMGISCTPDSHMKHSMDRGIGGAFDREFGRNEMGMSRNNFGESFERGMGNSLGMDRMNSGMDRLRMGMERMGPLCLILDRLGGSGFDRMGSGLDRLGPSMDRLGSGLDRMSSSVDRLGPAGFDRLGPSSLDRMTAGLDFTSPMGMGDRMNTGMDRMGTNFDRMGTGGIDRFPATGLDRMGSTMDRMGGAGVGGQFDRPAEMERGGFGGSGFGGAGGPGPGANARKGCQIFVRNVSIVQYADIKMENGKSKGCGVVRFDNPETADRACRTMNGYRLNGREIDVRIDRNA